MTTLLLSLAATAPALRAEETQYSKGYGELLYADTVTGDGAHLLAFIHMTAP